MNLATIAKGAAAWAVVIGVAWALIDHSSLPFARSKPAPRASAPAPGPRIEATLTVDGAAVHVVALPHEFGEVSRCVVAVSATGSVATSCAPKEFEPPPRE